MQPRDGPKPARRGTKGNPYEAGDVVRTKVGDMAGVVVGVNTDSTRLPGERPYAPVRYDVLLYGEDDCRTYSSRDLDEEMTPK